MKDFFNGQVGQTIEWFGLTHILLMVVFVLTLVLLWYLSPKIKNSKFEIVGRFILVGLAFLFEWKVFESRMLNNSLFRLPLCAIALYGLTFSVATKNKKVFKICYFYAFGAFLTFLFFDTIWGLDRWDGWTFFGAHAVIGWAAVYGVNVLDFKPVKKDLYYSILFLTIYAFISGFATYKYGGSDDLFLLNPPVEFLQFLIDIHQIVYLVVFSILAVILMYAMYVPLYLSDILQKRKQG
jgi:uncharacterized membrane protein YwaF